ITRERLAASAIPPAKSAIHNPQSAIDQDLDWIVMKCLEKDRTRRYETANGLAQDIERHLTHEPVVARPPSTVYRAQKFIRRNKVMVTAAGFVAMALVLGIAVSTWQALLARQAKRQAQEERREAVQAKGREAEQRIAAQDAERLAEQQAYAANINLAHQAWKESNLGRVRRLLAQTRPRPGQEDLRGWEWRYLWRLSQGDDLGEVARFGGGVWRIACAEKDNAIVVGLLGMAAEEKGGFLYDLGSNRLSNQRRFATHWLSGAVFVPGSGRLLSNRPDDGGRPGISVLDATTLHEVARLQTTNEVQWMRASRDGRWLACLEKNPTPGSTLAIWRTEDWSLRWTKWIDGHALFNGGRIEFLEGDRSLAAGTRDGKVITFETATGAISRIITAHSGGDSDEITALAYVPDSNLLAIGAGYADSKIGLWNPDTGEFIRNLTGHQAHIPDLALSPDGRWLASACADQTARLWDTKTWDCVRTLRGHEDEVYCLTFSSDSKRLITGDREGSVRLWQIPPAAPAPAPRVVREFCGSLLRLSPDSKRIVTFWPGTNCLVWDMETGKKLGSLSAPGGSQGLCQFSPDGRQLLVGGPGGKVHVWDFGLNCWSDFDTSRPGVTHTQPLLCVCGTDLVLLQHAVGTNIEFTLWQFGQRQLAGEFPGPAKPYWGCNFSSRRDFAMLHADGSFTLQKITAPFAQTNFWPHRRGVRDVAFTPDGALFATAGDDGIAKLWDSCSCREIAALKGHLLSTIHALDISADGRRLVTAGGREAIKLWDIQTHQELIGLDFEGWAINWILFSADGNKLVGLNSQRHLHIWRAPSWGEIAAAEAKAKANRHQP
ncbi:MAG TPA: hypothetical protein P5525_22345, partial [Candidatus Paceibacterota bacterium]|nr:hypothetical protein [Candidatus Paceibacterota bacterium]